VRVCDRESGAVAPEHLHTCVILSLDRAGAIVTVDVSSHRITGAETPLRGRERELARIDGLTVSACEGAGDIVVLEGAAGIGKSRLLAEGCARAAERGVLVAVGGGDELDQVTPWGLLLRALSSTTPALVDSSELDSLGGLGDRRLAVIEQLRCGLERASGERPLVVALDDLQWGDASTLLALSSLPLQLFSYPIGWLIARRPLPTSSPLDGLIERLEEAGASRLHLAPLAAPDATKLARDAAPTESDRELGALVAGAEGNPFYIVELLRARGERGEAGGGGGVLPQSVRAAVTQYLRSLSGDCRDLLSVASVLGREFSVAEVAAMTGDPASRLLAPVEEALAAEVLVERSDRLAFRHDLLRQAVYGGLPESARVALHRDAADALRRTGAASIRIATQLAIGASPGDTEAVTALNSAVSELAPASPSAAADLQLRALELLGEDDERRAAMVMAAVHTLSLAGRRAEGFELGERFLAEHELPPSLEATLQLELREAWVFERMHAYPSRLPEHLLRDPSVDRAIVAAALACQHADEMWDGHGEEAGRAFADAFEVVSVGGRPFELVTIAYLQVLNSALRGRMSDVLRYAESALAASKRVEPRTSGIHEMLFSVALAANGRIAEALAMLRVALEAAEAAGRTYFVVQGQWLRAFYLLAQGDLDDARGEARAEAATAEELGYSVHSSRGLAVLAETALRQGDSSEARSTLERFAPTPTAGSMPDRPWAAVLTAHARGDKQALAEALEPIRRQLAVGCFAISITQHHRLPQLTQMALGADQPEAAASFARAASTLAEQNPHVESLLAAESHAQGLIAHDSSLLEQAVEHAARSEQRLLEAAAREDLGRTLTAQNDTRAAALQLEHAHDLYARAGAHNDTARTRAALRAIGIRKRQTAVARAQHGWDSLTRSERRVADLVAQGMTNREAATELFLSPDTINTHLRHAFLKLGIRSRVTLARIAAERQPTTP
jgi:DNA-binding CsgD family transcriptional regulator